MEEDSMNQAKAESLELHLGMMLNGADGWCFLPILWTMVHPDILGTELLRWKAAVAESIHICLQVYIHLDTYSA